MTDTINSAASETGLRKFATSQWEIASRFLRSHFAIAPDDCKTIFRQAFLALYRDIHDGKLASLNASLPAYFITICRDMALSHLRRPADHHEMPIDPVAGTILPERIDEILALEPAAADPAEGSRRDFLVRWMVKDLPSPSNLILQATFRDNFSIPSLAAISNNTDATARQAIHRCCSKFCQDYSRLSAELSA